MTRLQTAQVSLYHARRRRRSLLDPASDLLRTHDFAPSADTIAVASVFPDRAKPITIAVDVIVTGASPAGVILELGSSTTGLALWIAAADDTIRAAVGDAVADDGVTLTGPAVVEGQRLDIVFAAIPSSGKARLWVSGQLVAWGEAAGGELPNGWAAASDGAVADVNGTVITRVGLADRIALSDAQVVSRVSAYHNQRPRRFSEVA